MIQGGEIASIRFAAAVTFSALLGTLLILSFADSLNQPAGSMAESLGLLVFIVMMMPVVSIGLMLMFGGLVFATATLLRPRTRWAGALAGLLPALFFAAFPILHTIAVANFGDEGGAEGAGVVLPLLLLACVAWSGVSAAALTWLFTSAAKGRVRTRRRRAAGTTT